MLNIRGDGEAGGAGIVLLTKHSRKCVYFRRYPGPPGGELGASGEVLPLWSHFVYPLFTSFPVRRSHDLLDCEDSS